ncbi:branched-chain amino acid ABC transporter permease [filamentous cyanobacterium CCP1]|nr:branched-chain amino acid ABC transporter permease [filamentous cyanobacterium CCP2]PSB67934.1 branched-chain amino acid ABC transporter permease [filamentous cyanobacterium CCP1]
MSTGRVRSVSSTPFSEFLSGCRGIFPLVVGAIPFGIIYGTLAASSGLSLAGTLAMSAFVFAGSSQFIAIGLLASGTVVPLIILTTFFVNLRHLLYSISIVPHVQQLSQSWKLPLGFLLTDEAFVTAIDRYNQPDSSPYKHWYQLGASTFMYLNWILCTWIGVTIGHQISNAAEWGLDFAMSATFIGMIIPYLKSRSMLLSVVSAGIMALLMYELPHQLGLILATLTGIFVGAFIERLNSRR